jgi:hypothetical protein
VEGKVTPKLASILANLDDKSSSLIVSDPKLGIPSLIVSSPNLRDLNKSHSEIIV